MLGPNEVADAYVEFMRGASDRLLSMIDENFFDNVSKQRGSTIWHTVASWLAESFSDVEVELHSVAEDDCDRVLVWITFSGTHIGSAFPFMAGRPATHRRIDWHQLHVFRVEGASIVEHWAVRDDLRVLEAIDR